jgi:hypothetical protein
MNEKVYCVNNYWDMTIIEGIAKYNNGKYYFECIFSDDKDNWTDVYNLTFLNEYIFKLSIDNWEYWKLWLKQSIIPHPVEYAKERKEKTVEKIFLKISVEKSLIDLTEKYYQNEIVIKNYIKNNKPIYQAKGTFCGDINGINNTEVKWENIIKLIE